MGRQDPTLGASPYQVEFAKSLAAQPRSNDWLCGIRIRPYLRTKPVPQRLRRNLVITLGWTPGTVARSTRNRAVLGSWSSRVELRYPTEGAMWTTSQSSSASSDSSSPIFFRGRRDARKSRGALQPDPELGSLCFFFANYVNIQHNPRTMRGIYGDATSVVLSSALATLLCHWRTTAVATNNDHDVEIQRC